MAEEARQGDDPIKKSGLARPSSRRSDRVYFDAVDPMTGTVVEAGVSVTRRRAEFLARIGPGAVREITDTVPRVLLKPTSVFAGIRREQDESREGDGKYCFSGRPAFRLTPDGRRVPASAEEVFLVFVNEEGVAYNWRWEDADSRNEGLPANHEIRFHRQLL